MEAGNTRQLPKISVVVITKNEERNIARCLDSLMAQDYPINLWECIVVDASVDRTPSIVAEYASVRLIRSNAGFSRQRNSALEAVRFDVVAFVDADTCIPAGWLMGIAAGFARHPEAGGLAGDSFPPPGTDWMGRCIAAVGHPGGGSLGLDANLEGIREGIAFIPGCNAAFRKAALDAVGGYSLDFEYGGEDVDISRRLRAAGYCLEYEPAMGIYHQPHSPLPVYIKWNIGVGLTKYSLNRPTAKEMILEPGSPLWAVSAFILLGFIFFVHPVFAIAGVACLHLILQLYLRKQSLPYRLLLRRREKVCLDPFSIWIVVPVLVYIRQLFMNIGMWKCRNMLKNEKTDL
ncbi:MAG: glycosyltransferase [Acidobacteria bacterium]|nr:glycosyltransferase [Acidobacteriota bacterium]